MEARKGSADDNTHVPLSQAQDVVDDHRSLRGELSYLLDVLRVSPRRAARERTPRTAVSHVVRVTSAAPLHLPTEVLVCGCAYVREVRVTIERLLARILGTKQWWRAPLTERDKQILREELAQRDNVACPRCGLPCYYSHFHKQYACIDPQCAWCSTEDKQWTPEQNASGR